MTTEVKPLDVSMSPMFVDVIARFASNLLDVCLQCSLMNVIARLEPLAMSPICIRWCDVIASVIFLLTIHVNLKEKISIPETEMKITILFKISLKISFTKKSLAKELQIIFFSWLCLCRSKYLWEFLIKLQITFVYWLVPTSC